MSETFATVLWRESLRDGPIAPDARDLMDWADVLDGAAAAAEAHLLRDCAAILQGFSPEALAEQVRGGVPSHDHGRAPAAPDWTTTAATIEIERLAREFAGKRSPTLAAMPAPAYSGYPHNPDGIGPGIPARGTPVDCAETARSIATILGDPDPDFEASALGTHLEALAEAHRRLPDFDYRAYHAAPIPLLARAIAQAVLVGFALDTRELWTAPLGSPAFLHATGRLGHHGLGPYFGNVGTIVRHPRDIYDIARRARAAVTRTDDRDVLGAWMVLLSRGCRDFLLMEMIDDLGDYAEKRALAAILSRLVSRPHAAIDRAMVMRVRDAGIDTGAYDLAARAQKIIVSLSPAAPNEQIILGDIHASAGDFAAAEGAYRAILETDPTNGRALERLAMARRNRFDGHHLVRGYGSPADRADPRLHRRGIHLEYPRRRGGIIATVDVS